MLYVDINGVIWDYYNGVFFGEGQKLRAQTLGRVLVLPVWEEVVFEKPV